MKKEIEFEKRKYEIIEAYYELYHKDNLTYPEARDKKSYCDMMAKQVGIQEIENMRKMSMRTVIETENWIVEQRALKLYRLICNLKERFYYNYEEMTDEVA